MSEERVVIDGKSYISSVRAAQLFGYTKDYVGQLARAGKIDSQLIGRSWYVEEDSIRKHKLSVHYTLTKPKKPRKQEDEGDAQAKYRKDEKTIENIDISESIKVLTGDGDTDPGSKKHDVSPDGYTASRDMEQHDLFPRPVKNVQSDALVKSEFIYEPDPEPVYTHDIVTASKLEEFSRLHMDGISLRTGEGLEGRTPLHRTSRENRKPTGSRVSTQGPVVPMDGIVLPESLSIENHLESARGEDDEDIDYEPAHLHRRKNGRRNEENVREPFFDEGRPSRLLPILGSLILFLLLTILYLSL